MENNAHAPSLVVLTGAGISADSGIATFRASDGLWESHRIEDVATPGGWRRDPALVWRFYQTRRAALQSVEPNVAHLALASFERRCEASGVRYLLVTQNVDDLHERAGSKVLHMHGELLQLRCERCGVRKTETQSFDPERFIPCDACGFEMLRPDVVWFEEMPYHLPTIENALLSCTHFLALGTSGHVYPAAGFLSVARGIGAKTFVQSKDPPLNLSPRDRFLEGRSVHCVPTLLEEIASDLGFSM